MKVQDLIDKLVHIANNCETSYKTGGWGQHNGRLWFFDCICLIKGILWGWNEDYNDVNGGAKYGSNGVYDDTEIGILNRCADVSSDFSNIAPGEYLYMKGHGGIYIGNGKVVECTVSWSRNVQITDISSDGTRSKNGAKVLKWEKHGKLPYIEYTEQTEQSKIEQKPVNEYKVSLELQKALNNDFRANLAEDNDIGPISKAAISKNNIKLGAKGQFVKWLQKRLIDKGYSVGTYGIDGSFGNDTNRAVKQFQKDNGLVVDGIVGLNTTLRLL